MLWFVGRWQPTPPDPTAPVRSPQTGEALPAVNPLEAETAVCVLLYDDENQNRLREPDEPLLRGGSIALTTVDEQPRIYITNGETEPFCFTGLTPGSYQMEMVPPNGFGLTSARDVQVDAVYGQTVMLNFGAAAGLRPAAPLPPPTAAPVTPTSPPAAAVTDDQPGRWLLAYSGWGVLVLAGVLLVAGTSITVSIRRGDQT